MSGSDESPRSSDPTTPRSRSLLVVVFLTIFIDFVGFSVLFPVLPLFAERLGATPFEIGLIVTLYALSQLLSLSAWGWISDRVGRRPVILVSLLGTALSFMMLAAADSVGGVYAARILSGFFAASIATAQAVVTDVTPNSERATAMGAIGAAFGLAMMIGPMLGGLMSSIDEKAPFYAVAGLALANCVFAWFRLPESRPREFAVPDWSEFRLTLIPPPVRLIAAVHDRRIGMFLYLFFHVFGAFAVLESMFTLYAGLRFGVEVFEMGLIFAWIALFLAFTQGFAIRRLVPRVGEANLVEIGIATMAVGLFGMALAPSVAWLYVVGPIIGIGNGLAIPPFTSLYSQACRSERAGELLGQSQSMATTGRVVGPLCGGLAMQYWDLTTPFTLAGAMMLLAIVLFRRQRPTLLGEAP